MESKRRFREAKVEIREDLYPPQEIERYNPLQQQLRKAFFQILPFLPEAHEQLDQLIDTGISLGMLTDIVSYMLDIDLRKKQSLLTEIDVYRRTELLLKYLMAVTEELDGDNSDFSDFPPLFSEN
jgi:Lon protease-like protein